MQMESLQESYENEEGQTDCLQTKEQIQKKFQMFSQQFKIQQSKKFFEIYYNQKDPKEALLVYFKKAFDITSDIKWLNKDKQFEIVLQKVNQAMNKYLESLSRYPGQRNNGKSSNYRQDLLKWLSIDTKFKSLEQQVKSILVQRINENAQMKTFEKIGKSMRNIIDCDRPVKPVTYSIKKYQKRDPDTIDFDNIKIAWSSSDQLKYKYFRGSLKNSLMTKSKGSPNWNDMSARLKINQVNYIYRNKLQRQEILQKYRNGEALTAKQVKFIANTNKLSTRCIDKEMIQRAISSTNPELISKIEEEVAQQVISNFESVQGRIKSLRHQYLLDKKLSSKRRFKSLQEQHQLITQHQNFLEELPKLRKVYSKALQKGKSHKDLKQVQSRGRVKSSLCSLYFFGQDEQTSQRTKRRNSQKRKQLKLQLRVKKRQTKNLKQIYSNGPQAQGKFGLLQSIKLLQHFFLRTLTKKRIQQRKS